MFTKRTGGSFLWKTLFVTWILVLCSISSIAQDVEQPPSGYTLLKETHIPIDLITEIAVELENEALLIVPSPDSILTAVSYGQEGIVFTEKEKANFLLTEKRLVIRAGVPKEMPEEESSQEPLQRVVLYVPEKYSQSLHIQMGSGLVEAPFPLSAGLFSLDLEDGFFSGAELTADRYRVQISSGTAELDNLIGSGKISVDAGEVKINRAIPDLFLQLECGSGSLDCTLDRDIPFQLQGSSGSGSLEADFPLEPLEAPEGETTPESHRFSATVGEGSYRQIKADADSGTLRLVTSN